ncbi:hydantoinase/oxoprolinase family protein [Nocardioides sp. SLBN-35]|uniref:hydantoinase/oxoprolinase family protein n=1 Tax=Nocardioides sp. SLBN-35 TaxID=2768445 RepID=UPI001173DF8D|nr:hydantoinase/oxoprolinase family protein [Nocardioides sp. SLBN-35]TQK72441.1 N-methylhydantoinase A [Nocardioides sp. SLBN-35]
MHSRAIALSVSADVGGTFTDVVTMDAAGAVRVCKSPSTHDAPVTGIMNALGTVGVSLAAAGRFIHGTTVGINTLLEHKGAQVALVVSTGMRDMIEIGSGTWPPYRLSWHKPPRLVPRELTFEIDERILADGSVRRPVGTADVERVAERLASTGVRAIAVCLINSYANPDHEIAVGAVLRERLPGVEIVLSHEITRRYRETERGVTALSEAYIRPTMREYFDRLEEGLGASGFGGDAFITSSDAGVMVLEHARRQSLRTLVSGCASGIAGAASLGTTCGYPDLICIDMGGTSFDAGIVRQGVVTMADTAVVADRRLLVPMVDLATIGAGGGSIAWVDEVGALHVGPQSAGSQPGPACYDRGGTAATFTDAALVSGLLPESLLSGEMKLDREAAERAIDEHVAGPLAMTTVDAAAAVVALTESRMARLLEEITVGRGSDPRDFTLLAYGGGGPMVGAVLGDLLEVRRVVIPMHAGVFSAWGMQTLDLAHEFARTSVALLSADTDIRTPLRELVEEAGARFEAEGVADERRSLLQFVEIRYDGQEHTLPVPILDGSETVADLRGRFEDLHERTYGFRLDGDLEVVGYRLRAVGTLDKPVWPAAEARAGVPDVVRHESVTHRTADASGALWPVYRREDLHPGVRLSGPAIVVEQTSTVLVTPRRTIAVDPWGNLVLDLKEKNA